MRELRNVVERALILTRGGEITGSLVEELLGSPGSGVAGRTGLGHIGSRGRPLKETMEELERQVVLEALELHGRQIAATARALGLERSHLYKKCQQLGIDLRALRTQ